jgi:hypothetical protein
VECDWRIVSIIDVVGAALTIMAIISHRKWRDISFEKAHAACVAAWGSYALYHAQAASEYESGQPESVQPPKK